eukprot:gene45192-60356_t
MAIEMIEEFDQGTQIKVIGVGGGGGNAVQHMIDGRVDGVEFISANTDAQALGRSTAHKIIQLGHTGLGAGSKPDMGREAAQDGDGGVPAFFVSDNGVGFDAGGGDRLYKPFERLHSGAEFPGYGLGLATARAVVARHGGEIY